MPTILISFLLSCQLMECLREERTTWEQEKETETRHIIGNMRDEMERTISKLRSDLEYERDMLEKHKRQITSVTAVSRY